MSRFNDTAQIVDDQDSSISYSGNWQHVPPMGSEEYMSTKSGAGPAGLKATFKFTGIGVEVYGSQGSVDVYGVPTTTYTIDGVLTGTYVQPVIETGFFTTHTMFFRSPQLSAGPHELVIETTNGTAPNMYWLDYIIFTPTVAVASQPNSQSSSTTSPATAPTNTQGTTGQNPSTNNLQSTSRSASSTAPSSASLPSTDPTPVHNSPTLVIPPNPTDVAPSPSASDSAPLAAAASSSSRVQAGPIAGGVIGGLILLTLIFVAFILFRRRQQRKTLESMIDIPPDANFRQTGPGDYIFPAAQGRSEVVPYGAWRAEPGSGGSHAGSGGGSGSMSAAASLLPYDRSPYDRHPTSPTSLSSRGDPFTDRAAGPRSEVSDTTLDSIQPVYTQNQTSTTAPVRLVPGQYAPPGTFAAVGQQSVPPPGGSRKGQPDNIGVSRSPSPGPTTVLGSDQDHSTYSGYSSVGDLPQLDTQVQASSPSMFSAVPSSVLLPPTSSVPALQAHQESPILTPVLMRHEDSGVRFQPTKERPLVEIPPAYSQA